MKQSILISMLLFSSQCIFPAQRAGREPSPEVILQQTQPVVYAPFGIPQVETVNQAINSKNPTIILSALNVMQNSLSLLIKHDNKPTVKREVTKLLNTISSFISIILKEDNAVDSEIKQQAQELLLLCAQIKKAFEISGHRR